MGRSLARAAVVAVLLGPVPAAQAATVGQDGTTLRYTADPGEVNDVRIAPGLLPGTLTVRDEGSAPGGGPVPIALGPGCTVFAGDVVCFPPDGGFTAVAVDVGDGARNEARVTADLPTTLTGGPGEDDLRGAGGADFLAGGGAADHLRGGGGDDQFTAAEDGATDTVECDEGTDGAYVDETDSVTACETVTFPAPPPPPPPPPPSPADPGPDPGPAPDPGPPPPPDPAPRPPEPTPDPGPAEPAPTPAPGGSADPRTLPMLTPRPVVRIAGRLTRKGAEITVLQVTAPEGALVTIRCVGRKCPARRRVDLVEGTRPDVVRRVRLRRFQRVLRAGTVLEISVTRQGTIGKHTRILIRRGKPPKRTDACTARAGGRAFKCPG